MIETDYIEKYYEGKSLFICCKIEIERVFQTLSFYENEISYRNKKVGIYRHVKKLIPCFDDFFKTNESNSVQSMVTLQRMIVDNYSILYLLTNYSTEEEQLLRYYLFLLDSMQSRQNLIDHFTSNMKYDQPEELFQNAEKTKISDNETAEELLKIIKQENLDSDTEISIIKTANWKFKDKKKKNQKANKYNWKELYSIARIPNHYAYSIQNYYSSFSHGLGVSLLAKNDETSYPLRITNLYLSSIILSMIIKILLNEYHEETKTLKINQYVIKFMNSNWNNWNKYKR